MEWSAVRSSTRYSVAPWTTGQDTVTYVGATSRPVYMEMRQLPAVVRTGIGGGGGTSISSNCQLNNHTRRPLLSRPSASSTSSYNWSSSTAPKFRPARASRLSAVVLNGCETVSLGFEIVRALPHLSVICWATITEDSAARAFSQGFYDAVGTSLLSREKVDLDLAFESGLEAFVEAGFASGDPAAFLHDELHPHRRFPVFSGCYGCCPPVHGVVLMLRSVGGRVEAKAPSLALRGSRWQRQVVCGDWFPVEEPSDLVDYAARYAASHREAASAPAPVCQPVKGGGAVHRGKESGKEAGVLLVGGDERPEETPEVAGGDRAMVAIEMDTLPVRHKL